MNILNVDRACSGFNKPQDAPQMIRDDGMAQEPLCRRHQGMQSTVPA